MNGTCPLWARCWLQTTGVWHHRPCGNTGSWKWYRVGIKKLFRPASLQDTLDLTESMDSHNAGVYTLHAFPVLHNIVTLVHTGSLIMKTATFPDAFEVMQATTATFLISWYLNNGKCWVYSALSREMLAWGKVPMIHDTSTHNALPW